VVPDVIGFCSFLASPERHLDNDLARSFYGTFLSHPETDLGFGAHVAFFSGTMVSFGILQISLILEESDMLTVLLAMIAISPPPLFSNLGRWLWEVFSSLRSSIPGPSSDQLSGP
jgi:hypothetical protein